MTAPELSPNTEREIPPGTLPPPITVEVWDNWEGDGEPVAAEIADVVRIGSRWHVVAVVRP